jgi:hypothetical protein
MARAGQSSIPLQDAAVQAKAYADTFSAELWSAIDAKSFPRKFPIDVLVKSHPSWCRFESGTFSLQLPVPAEGELLKAIGERADARLRAWLWRHVASTAAAGKVLKQGEGLCLMLTEKEARKVGPIDSWVGLKMDGEVWFGKVVKIAINRLYRAPREDGPNRATEALLAAVGAESVEQAQGRQLLLTPCRNEEQPGVGGWFDVKTW